MGKPFYVTAAIDYPNALPHLGTTYEKIGCDVLARHRRARGDDVRFTMGTDEHSQSVERAARKEGLDTETFCARQAELFRNNWHRFDVEPTAFVRTNSDRHRETSEWFMRTLHDKGHVYKGLYKAWFCPSCEQFYTEKEVQDSLCPVHQRPVEWVEEENYFFRLSAFGDRLLDLFEQNPEFLTPVTRRNEIINVIKSGLQDISISRGFTDWGFALTFDPSQVAYVWLDALPTYMTGIDFPHAGYERFWPVDVHVIGKDITRFHTVMWPAMLMAAELPVPKQVHAHGFVTIGGEKMSKTRGIWIDPGALVEQFGSDAIRYVLMAEIPFDRDGDFSLEVFIDRYNADLANDYGNLVSRTEKMVQKYFDGKVPERRSEEPIDRELREMAPGIIAKYDEAMNRLEFSEGINAAQELIGRANKYIEEVAPWKLNSAGDERLQTVCHELLEAVRISTLLMYPFVPRAAGKVATDFSMKLEGDLSPLLVWDQLQPGSAVGVGEILFPRLDREAVLAS